MIYEQVTGGAVSSLSEMHCNVTNRDIDSTACTRPALRNRYEKDKLLLYADKPITKKTEDPNSKTHPQISFHSPKIGLFWMYKYN